MADMTSLLYIVQQLYTWSSKSLNVAKCKIIAYIQEAQSILERRNRDDALGAKLAHVTLAGHLIGSLTQDEPLSGG
jgi:hypothetical protein